MTDRMSSEAATGKSLKVPCDILPEMVRQKNG
jgi:hypothetical protein